MKQVNSIRELKMMQRNLKLQLQSQEERMRQTTDDIVFSYKMMFTQKMIRKGIVSLFTSIKKKLKKRKKQKMEEC